MNEVIQRLIAKTGLPEDKAETAVETVIGFLKEKLPAPIASQIDGFLQQGESAGESGIAERLSGLGGTGSGLGGMLGRKE